MSIWSPPSVAEWIEAAPKEVKWLVDYFVPEDSVILLSGQQKLAFKTNLALCLSILVAAGKTFGCLHTSAARPVLYVYEEGSSAGTRSRLIKICKGLGVDPTSLHTMYLAHRQRVKLDDSAWRRQLIRFVQYEKPGLVVLDTMSYMHLGDENSVKEMSSSIETIQHIRDAGASVVVLAHLDKTKGGNPRADIDTQIRGTSLVVNFYDVHIACRRYRKSDMHIDMTVRHRDDEEKEFKISWTVEPESITPSVEPLEVGEMRTEELAMASYKLVDLDAEYHPHALKRLWDVSANTVIKYLGILEGKGKAIQSGKKWFFPKEE